MKIDLLIRNWGNFIHINHWYEQLSLPFISEKAKFNLLFEPIDRNEICERLKKELRAPLNDSLLDFYQISNGCRLFSDSLCIYGFQKHPNEIYESYDILIENRRKKVADHLIFGSYGSQYLLCYSYENPEKISVFNTDNMKKAKEFNDFSSCFETVFNNLLEEYDSNGRKKHISKQYRNIPVLANLTFDKKFLEE